jgi:phospholipid N-methyltransferase
LRKATSRFDTVSAECDEAFLSCALSALPVMMFPFARFIALKQT